MNKTIKTITLSSLSLILMFSISGCKKQKEVVKVENNNNQKVEQIATTTEDIVENDNLTKLTTIDNRQNKEIGIITGNMNYINPLYDTVKTCAENIDTKKRYCTNDYTIVKIAEHIRRWVYKVEVPAGKYHVYTVDPRDRRGYYTDSVLCGLTAGCADSNILIVNIQAGEMVENISPLDWYGEWNRDK